MYWFAVPAPVYTPAQMIHFPGDLNSTKRDTVLVDANSPVRPKFEVNPREAEAIFANPALAEMVPLTLKLAPTFTAVSVVQVKRSSVESFLTCLSQVVTRPLLVVPVAVSHVEDGSHSVGPNIVATLLSPAPTTMTDGPSKAPFVPSDGGTGVGSATAGAVKTPRESTAQAIRAKTLPTGGHHWYLLCPGFRS